MHIFRRDRVKRALTFDAELERASDGCGGLVVDALTLVLVGVVVLHVLDDELLSETLDLVVGW